MGEIYKDIEQVEESNENELLEKILENGYAIGERNDLKFRDTEINRIYNIMDKSAYRSVLLVGDYGSGKRSIIEGYVSKINENYRNDAVIGIDFEMFRSHIQENTFLPMVNEIFYNATHNQGYNVVLVLNNIGHILNINCYGNLGFSFINILTSYIENDNLRIIATATNDEYKMVEDAFKRVLDFFTVVKIPDMPKNQAKEILDDEKQLYENYYNITLPDSFSEIISDNADKYIKDKVFPGKGEQLLDEVCASISNKLRPTSDELKETAEHISNLKNELKNAVENNDYQRSEDLKEEIKNSREKFSDIVANENIETLSITDADILEAIGEIVNVNMSKLNKDQTVFLREMPIELKKHIIGQDEAVDMIVKNIRRNQLGLRKTSHSMGNFMFIGSTGVGKTFLAKQLAKYLYGSEDSFLRLDMSEFQTEIDVSKLLGSAPGYVGYKESGLLVKGLAKKPETVVLFDEIEKAHPKIYDVLLQLLDEGFVTGSDGKKVDATKALIIFTSNIGVKQARDMAAPLGFSNNIDEKKNDRKEKTIRKALKNRFSPEFLNRLDNICYFNPLGHDTLINILHNELDEMNEGIKNITGKIVEITSNVEEWILEKVEKEDNGARPIIRILQQNIEEQIADMVINEDEIISKEGDVLVADLNENGDIIIR